VTDDMTRPLPTLASLKLPLLTLVSSLALLSAPVTAAAQAEPAPPLMPVVAELPLSRFADDRCLVSGFVRASDPTAEQAGDLVGTLAGASADGSSRKTYVWILWFPAASAGAPDDTVATRVYDRDGGRFVSTEKLYEAEELRLLVILPAAGAPSGASAYAVRAGTAVRKEKSLLAAGFPSFLAELAGGLFARELVPGCPPPFAEYDVAVHVTQLADRDATVAARVEVDASPPLDAARAAETLAAFQTHRVEVEAGWLGYTQLGVIFDAIEGALAGPACADASAATCLQAARAAAVETVAGMQLSAEHTITAVRTGTEQALAVVEELLAERHAALERTFRVVDRPVIGFSVGGILAEGSGEDLEFDVEDGVVTADGVAGDGFKALALIDLYFRRVDISESSPGIVPHASVGFTIGEVFRPGVFLATTLPFTAGRLSVFAGGILRKTTDTDLPVGTVVEPGTEPIDEGYKVPFVVGLKVGLPL
jgi:hypothetical protein